MLVRKLPLFFASISLSVLASCGGDTSTDPVAPPASPLTRGLVAYWSFDGTGDTASDLSGNGHHLALHGVTSVAGHSGTGASFNGTSSYALCTSVKGLGLDTFSLVTWIKTSSSTRHQAVISRESQSGFPSNFRVLLDGPDAVVSAYQSGHISLDGQLPGGSFNRGNITASKTAVDDGNWHLVVAVGAGTKATVWIDGQRDTSRSVSTAFKSDTASALGIGYSIYQSGSYFFHGALDEIRIYNRVLDSSDIQLLLK